MLDESPTEAHGQRETLVIQSNVARDATRVAQEITRHRLERIDQRLARRDRRGARATGVLRRAGVDRIGMHVLDTRRKERAAGRVERVVAAIPGDTEPLREGDRHALGHAKQSLLCWMVLQVTLQRVFLIVTENLSVVALERRAELHRHPAIRAKRQRHDAGVFAQAVVAGVISNVYTFDAEPE